MMLRFLVLIPKPSHAYQQNYLNTLVSDDWLGLQILQIADAALRMGSLSGVVRVDRCIYYLVWVWSSNNDVFTNTALSDSKRCAASSGSLQSPIRLVIMIENSFFY